MMGEAIIVLKNLTDKNPDILLGWAIPQDHLGSFLCTLNAAALEAGGAPLEEVLLDTPDTLTTSAINRAVFNSRTSLINDAERIMQSVDDDTEFFGD